MFERNRNDDVEHGEAVRHGAYTYSYLSSSTWCSGCQAAASKVVEERLKDRLSVVCSETSSKRWSWCTEPVLESLRIRSECWMALVAR